MLKPQILTPYRGCSRRLTLVGLRDELRFDLSPRDALRC